MRRNLSLLLALVLVVASGAAKGATAFPDLSGHWAAGPVAEAVAAGHVNGYPDGTFRPDAQVTRAEFVKLLVKAGALPLRRPGSSQVFNDVSAHWVVQQGLLDTAGAYGIVIASDYAGAFEPDRPITRREAAIQAVRLLGKQHVVDKLNGDVTLTDAAAMPLRERQHIQEAMQDGILTGYPDNTFGSQLPISRAEAVIIAERAARAMRVGEDAGIQLVVNGKVTSSPVPLSVRDGYVYAPADVIYGGLGRTATRVVYDSAKNDLRLLLFPANELFIYERSRAEFPAGAAYAYLRMQDKEVADSAMQRVPLLAPTYLDQGRLMIPIAGPNGSGTLPYASGYYNRGARQAAVTKTAYWPDVLLPQTPTDLRFVTGSTGFSLHPGLPDNLPRPVPVAAGGDRVAPVDDPGRFIFHVAVDPASPIRLRAKPGAPLVTSLDLTLSAMADAQITTVESQDPVPEGTWNLTYAVPGYSSAALPVYVADNQPIKLDVSVTQVSAGQQQTITVRLVNRQGRVIQQSFPSDLNSAGPTVTVTLPDGRTAEAAPVVHTDNAIHLPFILVDGVGTFTFTPAVPGTYQYMVRFRGPTLRGDMGFVTALSAKVGP